MKGTCAVLLVLFVLTLGFDHVAGWAYGTTCLYVVHNLGAFLEKVGR